LAARADGGRAKGAAARVFAAALARLGAVLALAAARRAISLLPDFALADRAALLLAVGRDGRAAAATALRLRDAVDPADALAFFTTVLDAFLVAFLFLRAAMSSILQTHDDPWPELRGAGVDRLIVTALGLQAQRIGG